MNVTLKALVVAAVAAMSVSGAAKADTLAGTDSNLYFVLMDTVLGQSLLIDLSATDAPTFSKFDTGAVNSTGYSYDWNLNSYSDLDKFDITSSSVKWGVFTAKAAGTPKKIVVTVNSTDSTLLKTPVSSSISTDSSNLNTLVQQGNASKDLVSVYFSNSATVATNPQSAANFGKSGILGGNTFNAATTNVGGTLGIVEYTTVATSSKPALVTLLGNEYGATTFTFSKNDVDGFKLHLASAVSAVPEADSLSMMMAGLGLMGLVAVRRKQQA